MILTFASRKGGVGKTTCAVNIAAALAAQGFRTLLVDADPQASSSLSLGVPRTRLSPSLADAIDRNVPLPQLARSTSTPGLDLVTASADLGPLGTERGFSKTEELLLHRVVVPHSPGWDHVVIDPPPGQSLLTRGALAAAELYVVPAIPHFLAVEGIEQLFGIVRRLTRRSHVRPQCLGILPTMVDRRSRSVQDMLTALRGHFGELLFEIEIPLNTRVAEAPAHGRTVLEHAPDSRGAVSYRAATRELLARAARLACPNPL